MSLDSRACPHCDRECSGADQYCPACGFPVAIAKDGSDDRFVGRTLPGGHHILDLISVGGMGRVYRAEQSVLGRTVAVKIIHPHLLSDENSALRFLTEARAASQLNHPNSVAVFDFGRTDDGQPYLVMEFLRGRDLARVNYEEGPLQIARIVEVLKQVLGALGEAHELGIVHRDLKPENVILEPLRRGGDFVKVVDFGLAKLRADTQGTSVTSPGIVCGTPDYMAPEQGRGDDIDGRADLYAVGIILFQLLTGRLPFEAESPTQVVMMHLSIPVPDPRQVAPERMISDELAAVVLRALEKDANKRFQAAHEFVDALTGAVRSATSQAPERMPMAARPGATMACPECGKVVPAAKFCGECAAPLPQQGGPGEGPTLELPLLLMGRDEDLAWLEGRRDALVNGVTGARIVGEHGSGKTRLLNDFIGKRRDAGDLVVSVGPDPYWAEVAYYTLREAVRGLSQLGEEDIEAGRFGDANPDARRALQEVFAGLPNASDRRSPLERRRGLTEALLWALEQATLFAESGKVILVVDDLDRVDVPSRHALSDCLGESNASALLIGTHIPGFDTGWSEEHAPARVLADLPPSTAARLLSAAPLPLPEDTNGARRNLPMYIEYLLRYTMEGGSDPPSLLGDLVALRIDTLSSHARRALQGLAVLGNRVDRELLGEILGDSTDLSEALNILVQSGMAVEDEGLYSAAHPLLREIAMAGIPMEVRRELHERALQLREGRAAPLEARATHAYFAQDSFHALLLLEQVAERAASRGDSQSEVLALRRGLVIARQEISRGELDDPLRAVLIFSRKLGTSLTRAGDFADAEGVLREALDIAGPSSTDRARVLDALAHVAHGRRRGSEAIVYIDQAIETATASGAHELLTRLRDTRRLWAS